MIQRRRRDVTDKKIGALQLICTIQISTVSSIFRDSEVEIKAFWEAFQEKRKMGKGSKRGKREKRVEKMTKKQKGRKIEARKTTKGKCFFF